MNREGMGAEFVDKSKIQKALAETEHEIINAAERKNHKQASKLINKKFELMDEQKLVKESEDLTWKEHFKTKLND